MDILQELGVALGLASLSGVNLYLTVLLAGLAMRFNLLHLADQHHSLEVLGHPAVIAVAGTAVLCCNFSRTRFPGWIRFGTRSTR